MRAIHGTAIYTGGGFYNVIGETDDGHWFFGGYDYCCIANSDVREKNEYGDLACFYNDWAEKHEVEVDKKEMYEMIEDFCRRLDAKEPGLTDGYKEFSNYTAGEVTDYMDFSEFVDYQPEGKIIVKGVTPDQVGTELALEIINNALIYEFSLIVKALERIDDILSEIEYDPKHNGFYLGFENPEKMFIPFDDNGSLPDNDKITTWYKITYSNGDYNLYKIQVD